GRCRFKESEGRKLLMQKALVTSGEGFVGRHLVDALARQGYEVHATCKSECEEELPTSAVYHVCDVVSPNRVNELLFALKPDVIFHLAGISFVPDSFDDPWQVFEVNLRGALNILSVSCRLSERPMVVLIGSGEEYGVVDEKLLPTDETTPLRPLSPYAVSKASADLLGYQYFSVYGLPVVRVRPFNHTGPGQSPRFVCSSFAKQIAMIEKGKQEPVIAVGNVSAVRDFTDVRDVINAYMLLVRYGRQGDVYNVCSGKGYRISDILDMLIDMTDTKVEVRIDESKLREIDIPVMVGDCSKLVKETGWKRKYEIKETLRDLLNYWRALV
ncbi:MAG: GDP-mannose 4,6-dehydratase, partial [Synergistetes bacterium]|nr:GDP-mannose 4,6-dehydratase [Synergistota bacterium]